MAGKTPNHELNTYEPGDENWSHSADMETIEERLVVRAPESDREDYEPYEDAIFVATDTGAVYDGDGWRWVEASRRYDELDADEAEIGSCVVDEHLSIPTYDTYDEMIQDVAGRSGWYLGVVDGSLDVIAADRV